ncbi:DUF6449 domain-containing protein [Chryseobacterium mucoviscidosis]|uniref:DUF6449 domain-containing protein n=1 Tax=Chryseobacterium mucoviscidosis TaxID=1945581 RepID=UPI0031D52ECE
MENELSWFDRVITPKTKAYKDFAKEVENTSPEIFYRDGERKFSEREKKFMHIHKSTANKIVQGSAYTVNTIFDVDTDTSVKTNYKSSAEVVRFINKQKTDGRILIIQDNTAFTELTIDNEAAKQKYLSDSWAKELEVRTDLSFGMTTSEIDDRQADHYRKYEIEVKKLDIEINPSIEEANGVFESMMQLDGDENVPEFDEFYIEETLTPATNLPEGWIWRDYDDGSGSLRSPSGYSYYSYDLQTQEYRLPTFNNRWTDMKDVYDRPKSLNEFKIYAEKSLKEGALQNNFSPKLSEDEKNGLLNYIHLNKEDKFILDNLNITEKQRMSYSKKEDFSTVDEDYTLTSKQLEKIPDTLDGHTLSKNDKYELAFVFLEKQQNGESYELLQNGEILKTYLDEDSLPSYKILTENDIKFNKQNTEIMETQKEFDQVKYLKDQMKYLGFGEDEKLHKDLEKGIKGKAQQFEIKTSSDKTLPENKVDFILKFNKSDSGGVFLNSYNAKLTNDNKEEKSHNFPVSRENSFTAKEAVNLLEGRSVKIDFVNPKSNQTEPAFVQFNFNEPKTDKGNYYFQNFYKNYGVDTAEIVEKSNLLFDNPEWKENSIKSLEKGNVVKVKFKENDQVVEAKAVLDPQNRNLKLYDNEMNRINTNKPLEGLEQDNSHDKANVREQSIKR